MNTTTIQLPKRTAGVYLLKCKEAVVYVGASRNPIRRIGSHVHKRFDCVDILWVRDSKRRSLLESRLIKQYRPKYNKGYLPRPRPERSSRQKSTLTRELFDEVQKLAVGCYLSASGRRQLDDIVMVAEMLGKRITTRRNKDHTYTAFALP